MCHICPRPIQKTQLSKDHLEAFSPLIEETFSDSPQRLSELRHTVSAPSLPSFSSTFFTLSQNWLYCQWGKDLDFKLKQFWDWSCCRCSFCGFFLEGSFTNVYLTIKRALSNTATLNRIQNDLKHWPVSRLFSRRYSRSDVHALCSGLGRTVHKTAVGLFAL